MQRIHLVIHGNVQGVGFRVWTIRQAKHLGLVGWVKNTNAKTVEVVAEGLKNKLEEFVRKCKTGPIIAEVGNIEVEWHQADGSFSDFTVMY